MIHFGDFKPFNRYDILLFGGFLAFVQVTLQPQHHPSEVDCFCIVPYQCFVFAGILMDLLVFKYHQNKFENSGITFEIKEDVKNSKTSIGVMFSRPSLKNWAAFLNRFLLENGDVESRLLRQAIGLTKSEVGIVFLCSCILSSEKPGAQYFLLQSCKLNPVSSQGKWSLPYGFSSYIARGLFLYT